MEIIIGFLLAVLLVGLAFVNKIAFSFLIALGALAVIAAMVVAMEFVGSLSFSFSIAAVILAVVVFAWRTNRVWRGKATNL